MIPLFARAQSAQLRAEVVDARNWLRSHLAEGAGKGKKKNAKSKQSARAATARSAKSKGKRQQGRMNGDRPLPGHGR
ncbi:hypothetical protein [Streptomyces sp. NPDC046197]|uniref:hypothetical protein n=1 Tax=Streptomyces sp. NPDC046197 TaxID=3154337 RepID=UPI0033C2D109